MSAATAARLVNIADNSFESYQELAGVNWSTLREIEKSELHYVYRRLNPREDTARLALGRLVHTAVLQPDRLDADYAAFEGDKRTKAWREFKIENANRTCVAAEEMEQALAIARAVHRHPAAARLLAHCNCEQAVVWRERESGLVCKCRVDALTPRTIVEFKTTTSVDPEEFARLAGRMGYHKQLAFYRRGVKAALKRRRPAVRLIAVEIEPPFDVAVFRLDEDVLYAAHEQTSELLLKAASAARKQVWRGRSERVERLPIPPWFYAADEDDFVGELIFKETP